MFDEYMKCNDELVKKFFDVDSLNMLKKKTRVLKKLNQGVAPGKIKEYYDILEKYPDDELVSWT